MKQTEMIHTFLNEFRTEQKEELVSLIKSGDEKKFVSELSLFPSILLLIVALVLALFSRGAIKDAFMFVELWEIKRLPEYFLLFTVQILFILLVFYSLFIYIRRINRHGWINAPFGLVYIDARRLTIFSPESIENIKINQMLMNYHLNEATKRWESSDSINAQYTEITKKYDIEISVKAQVKKEIFAISNRTDAYGFVNLFYQNANSGTSRTDFPLNSKHFPIAYRWFIVLGIALFTSVLSTSYLIFPFENKMVLKQVAQQVLDSNQPNGITRDKECLIHYIQYCKNGENYSKAIQNLREYYKAKINPVKAKLLLGKDCRYEYLNLLVEYEEYVHDNHYRDEIELLKNDSSGYELWKKKMTE